MIRGETTLKSITSTLTAAGLVASLMLTQIGCTESGQEPVAEDSTLATPIPEGMVRGTVLETMDSGGYTYVYMETAEDRRWVAAQQTTIQVGDVVETSQGMPMTGFESKTLNRTFDVVYFVGGLENLSVPSLPEGHPAGELPAGHPSIDETDRNVAADIKVIELEPGLNIAYVYASRGELAGHEISLRGKVVKYNEGILGWNFIHIQDGSGDIADGSNDLTVTSHSTTAVGETVVVTGTIILQKDFGSGYSFPVMMEGAAITAE